MKRLRAAISQLVRVVASYEDQTHQVSVQQPVVCDCAVAVPSFRRLCRRRPPGRVFRFCARAHLKKTDERKLSNLCYSPKAMLVRDLQDATPLLVLYTAPRHRYAPDRIPTEASLQPGFLLQYFFEGFQIKLYTLQLNPTV